MQIDEIVTFDPSTGMWVLLKHGSHDGIVRWRSVATAPQTSGE